MHVNIGFFGLPVVKTWRRAFLIIMIIILSADQITLVLCQDTLIERSSKKNTLQIFIEEEYVCSIIINIPLRRFQWLDQGIEETS